MKNIRPFDGLGGLIDTLADFYEIELGDAVCQ